jgi:hypothetical protein
MSNTHSIDLEASSNQHLSISDATQTGLDITGDLTVECWIKLESQPGVGADYIMVNKWGGGGQRGYSLRYYNRSGVPELQFYVSSNGSAVDGHIYITTLNSDTWYHVAVAFDASAAEAEFYLDGVSKATSTLTATAIHNSNSAFFLGAYYTGTYTVDGLMDDVRIWDDVRTGVEISSNKDAQLIGSEANLQGYWRLNNDATDLTSNSNDLTASNSPVYSADVPFAGGGGPVFIPRVIFF